MRKVCTTDRSRKTKESLPAPPLKNGGSSTWLSPWRWICHAEEGEKYGRQGELLVYKVVANETWKHIGFACVLIVSDSLHPMDCSPPGLAVHGIFQARILDWVAISYSRGSSPSKDWTRVSCTPCVSRQILYHCTTWETPYWIWRLANSLMRE